LEFGGIGGTIGSDGKSEGGLRTVVMEKAESRTPKLAKAHSSLIADLYVQAGWTIKTEFRVAGDDEPYEYLLEWPYEGEPVRPVLPK